MISIALLVFEILLDITGVVTSIIIMVNFPRERLTRAWGILALTLSSLLLFDNIEWIYPILKNPSDIPFYINQPLDHLSLWHIFRVIIFLQAYSLFPVAFLRQGWLNTSKAISLSIPTMLISCVAFCFEQFNNHYTHLGSFADIVNNIANKDVIVRLILFIASVVSPYFSFAFIFFQKEKSYKWHESLGMRFFAISFILIVLAYFWLMLGTSPYSFHIFGCVVISLVIYMNILHLRGLEPFLPYNPVPEELIKDKKDAIEVLPVIVELSQKLQIYMKEETPFTNPNYSIHDLLSDLNVKENKINQALHYMNYSGFRDYINYERVEYFKKEAALHRNKTVKELLYQSGFTSRSSFYRHFSNIEKISPTEYIEKLNNTQEVLIENVHLAP